MEDFTLWMRARTTMQSFMDGIELVIMGQHTDGRRSAVKQIIYEDVEEGVSVPKALVLDKIAAKQLMNDLWISGIRPDNDLIGSTNKDDMKNHLEDMRNIVFNGLTINLEQAKNTKPVKSK